MIFKALARNKKTGFFEWYKNIYTDGESVYINTKKGMLPLKGAIQLWCSLNDHEQMYYLVFEQEKDQYDKDIDNEQKKDK